MSKHLTKDLGQEWGGTELSGSVQAQPMQGSDSSLNLQQNKTRSSSMPKRNAL